MFTAGWLVCEDPGCSGRTRVMPLQFQRAYPQCGVCRVSAMYQEYSAANLYTQILYMVNLVDKTKMINDDVLQTKLKAYNNGNAEQQYDGLKQLVERKFLKHNGYSTVSLSKLFEGLFPSNHSSTPAQAWD